MGGGGGCRKWGGGQEVGGGVGSAHNRKPRRDFEVSVHNFL